MRIFVRQSLLILCALCVGGCALQAANQAAQQIYRLQPIRDPIVDADSGGMEPQVIHLLPVGAAPGLGSTAMLYSKPEDHGVLQTVNTGVALMPYRDSRWLAPPAQLIGAAISRTLARQSWVSAVETDTPLAPATWTLHCSLGRLEHDVLGASGVVRLDLTCQIIRHAPRRIVAHWHFDAKQSVEKNDARHYAMAAQDLLDQALRDMVRRVHAQMVASVAHES